MSSKSSPEPPEQSLIEATDFQTAVLRWRRVCYIVNAGGRGSGKSFAMLLCILDHARELGRSARPLVVRESHNGLLELQNELWHLCRTAFGRCDRNKQEHTLTLPSGAVIYLTNIGDEESYAKWQGKSITALYADEMGNYPPQASTFVMKLMSNLRPPIGHKPEVMFTANPHGRSHSILYKNYIKRAPAWKPFQDDAGNWWLWTQSNLEANPHIDQDQYKKNLITACGHDKKLAEAWIAGDWSVLGGNMFQSFDASVHVVELPQRFEGAYRIGGDWGTAAPAVGLLVAQLFGPLPSPFRHGDVIVFGETDTVADPNDLSTGNGAPPQIYSEQLKEMSELAGLKRPPQVVMDDARGLQSDTVIKLLREEGLFARKPYKKDRVGTWALINSMLYAAKHGQPKPGLWFTADCPHLLETLPEAPRGTIRAEDVDPKWPKDHWIDAMGYGVRDFFVSRLKSGRTRGNY